MSSKEELLQSPQFLDKYDIMKIFSCGVAKAIGIIRAIKAVSDSTKIKGKVTLTDYQIWYNKTGKQL